MTKLSYPIVTPLIFHTKAPLHVSDRARLNSQMLGEEKKKKKIMRNKERNFSPSVFPRERSHACRKLRCMHYGINSEGLKHPTVSDALLLDPQNRTVNQCGTS